MPRLTARSSWIAGYLVLWFFLRSSFRRNAARAVFAMAISSGVCDSTQRLSSARLVSVCVWARWL